MTLELTVSHRAMSHSHTAMRALFYWSGHQQDRYTCRGLGVITWVHVLIVYWQYNQSASSLPLTSFTSPWRTEYRRLLLNSAVAVPAIEPRRRQRWHLPPADCVTCPWWRDGEGGTQSMTGRQSKQWTSSHGAWDIDEVHIGELERSL